MTYPEWFDPSRAVQYLEHDGREIVLPQGTNAECEAIFRAFYGLDLWDAIKRTLPLTEAEWRTPAAAMPDTD